MVSTLESDPLSCERLKTMLALLAFSIRSEQGCLLRIADHEESGVVVRIVVDFLLQHLHAIHPGSVGRADGCPSVHLVLGDECGRTCGILSLHRLEIGMVGEELATLHQRYRMRVNLLQGAPVVGRQAADAVLDVELALLPRWFRSAGAARSCGAGCRRWCSRWRRCRLR